MMFWAFAMLETLGSSVRFSLSTYSRLLLLSPRNLTLDFELVCSCYGTLGLNDITASGTSLSAVSCDLIFLSIIRCELGWYSHISRGMF